MIKVNNRCDKMLEGCDFVKTILMISVVLYHSMIFWSGMTWFIDDVRYTSKFIYYLCGYLHSIRMQAFTLVSGYLYYYLRYEKNRYQEFFPFFFNKVKRLVVPAYFMCLFWVLPISLYFFNYNKETVILKYLMATSPNQLWFLWMLFDIFIIIWCLSNIVKRNNSFAILLCLFFWIIGVVCPRYIANYFCIWTSCSYIMFFLLGFKIRQFKICEFNKNNTYSVVLVHIVVFILYELIKNNSNIGFKVSSLVLYTILQLIGALVGFIVLIRISNNFDWKNNKIFMVLQKKSMIIFLFHQQIIYFTITFLNGVINPYLNIMINFIVSIVGSCIIGHFAIKNKYLRILLGEK